MLKTLADNKALMETVKAHILEQFKDDNTQPERSDQLLGQIYRAQLLGRATVEAAFQEIERLQEPAKVTEEIAKHR